MNSNNKIRQSQWVDIWSRIATLHDIEPNGDRQSNAHWLPVGTTPNVYDGGRDGDDVDNDDDDAELVAAQVDWGSTRNSLTLLELEHNKNSPEDEIANVNFYAVRPEATRIR